MAAVIHQVIVKSIITEEHTFRVDILHFKELIHAVQSLQNKHCVLHIFCGHI